MAIDPLGASSGRRCRRGRRADALVERGGGRAGWPARRARRRSARSSPTTSAIRSGTASTVCSNRSAMLKAMADVLAPETRTRSRFGPWSEASGVARSIAASPAWCASAASRLRRRGGGVPTSSAARGDAFRRRLGRGRLRRAVRARRGGPSSAACFARAASGARRTPSLDLVGQVPDVGHQLAVGHEADVDGVPVAEHRDVQAGALHDRPIGYAATISAPAKYSGNGGPGTFEMIRLWIGRWLSARFHSSTGATPG